MYKLSTSILKIILFLISISIYAEDELTEQNTIVDSESVEVQNEEESILSSEDRVVFEAEAQTSSEELETEAQLNLDIESTSPIDVMLVLDNSGSMKKNDPKFLVTEAIKEFIGQKNENTRVGIIIFDGKVQLKVPLTAASFANRETILNSIRDINYKGQYTDFPAAVERAIYELKDNGRVDALRSIIFMTDGIVDTGDVNRDLEKSKWMREDLAADAADNEIKVFGIAFTEAADFQLIQSISQQTQGEYFRVLVAEDLKNVFQQINEAINKEIESSINTVIGQVTSDGVVSGNINTIGVSKLPDSDEESIATIKPRIEAVEQALDSLDALENLGEPIPFPTILFMAALVLVLLLATLFFLITQRKGFSKVVKDEPFQEAYLNDLQGKTEKQAHMLDERPKMIGRVAAKDTEHMDYIVVNESTISRRHALIEYKDYSFWIIDQGSSNGTFINNERIKNEVRLKHGDKIRLHNYEFEFIVPEMDESDETIVYKPGMQPLVDDIHEGSSINELTYGLEEIANNPGKSKVASISPISDESSDEEVTIIHNATDISDDTDSLINEDVGTSIDDDDDDDDTTVIVR
ncbi:MAG: VWA domain-containing protein [Pseudomonadota bacterium]|nr:VWA domain-containing protein [Pseudomonadota bacterium]